MGSHVCFQKSGYPQNEWFIRENPIKMDDLKVPLFVETPTCGYSWESTFFLPPCTSYVQVLQGIMGEWYRVTSHWGTWGIIP